MNILNDNVEEDNLMMPLKLHLKHYPNNMNLYTF